MSRARRPRRGSDAGSAVALLAVALAVIALVLLLLTASGALVARQRVVDAADAAALAAADAASGAVSGIPCERAAEVARADGAELDRCAMDDAGVVEVKVRARVLGSTVAVSARAGPP